VQGELPVGERRREGVRDEAVVLEESDPTRVKSIYLDEAVLRGRWLVAAVTENLRLAVAAAPALLAGSLRALFADAGVEVTILLPTATPDRAASWGSEPFDLVMVVPGREVAVDATRTLVLDDRPDSRGGGTLVERDGGTLQLADLVAVRRYVRDLATSSSGSARRGEGERGEGERGGRQRGEGQRRDEAGASAVGDVDDQVAAELPKQPT
jgi:hypothetical protein